jgi:hypothetical protein
MTLRNGASPVPAPIRQGWRPSIKLSDTSVPVAWLENQSVVRMDVAKFWIQLISFWTRF